MIHADSDFVLFFVLCWSSSCFVFIFYERFVFDAVFKKIGCIIFLWVCTWLQWPLHIVATKICFWESKHLKINRLQNIVEIVLVKWSHFPLSKQWVELFKPKIFINILHVVVTGVKCIATNIFLGLRRRPYQSTLRFWVYIC